MLRRPLRQLVVAVGLVMLSGALSGCIVEDGGGGHHGWCWWHSGACH